MTKKEKTIKACKEMIFRYRNPLNYDFFKEKYCPLCKVHLTKINAIYCKGCPLADILGQTGCIYFRSFHHARNAHSSFSILYTSDAIDRWKEAALRRAEFFEKIIPILEKIPEKRFTKNGWRYFDEIKRRW